MIHDFPKQKALPILYFFWKRASFWLFSSLALIVIVFFTYRFYSQKSQSIPTLLMLETQGERTLQPELVAYLIGGCELKEVSLKEMKHRLNETAILKFLKVKRVSSKKLFISYDLRSPFLRFGNLTNQLLDEEGVLFPAQPYFPPLQLPTLYVGEHQYENGCVSPNIMRVVKELSSLPIFQSVTLIDFSKSEKELIGEREITIKTKEGAFIRLPTEGVETLVNQFCQIPGMIIESKIYDLRIKNILYVRSLNE